MFLKRRQRASSRRVRQFAFPAPIQGLVRSGDLLDGNPAAAEVLENFIPTAEGARVRSGSAKYATLPSEVKSLMTFSSGEADELFGATETAIYPLTNVADPDTTPTASVTGLSSGDWSSAQFATSGGQFLVLANGVDTVRKYDGSTWDVSAITGVTNGTQSLHFVWSHKRRLWFAEEGLAYAWYLPADSVEGAATAFPLDGVFRLGGSLLMGGSVSTDTGDGIDDLMVFISTKGEVAAYQGTDPSSASSWALVGVYRIARPLHKDAFYRSGGDLMVLTEEGIISILGAMAKRPEDLQGQSLTAPIESFWQQAVARRQGTQTFSIAHWPSRALLFIGIPDENWEPGAIVANTRTGSWATITGWPMTCQTVFADSYYFGTSDGLVLQGETGGNDNGSSYTARYVPKFNELKSTSDKLAMSARLLWRGTPGSKPRLGCFTDYTIGVFLDNGTISLRNVGATWGTAAWGSFQWGSDGRSREASSDWQTVVGAGYALAPTVSVTANDTDAPDFALVGLILRYEEGTGI